MSLGKEYHIKKVNYNASNSKIHKNLIVFFVTEKPNKKIMNARNGFFSEIEK